MMLTNSDDIYKFCPIFNHIISKKPEVGDYIINQYQIGIITNIRDEYDEFDDRTYTYADIYTLMYSYCSENNMMYNDSNCSFSIDEGEQAFVIITKELCDIIINKIGYDAYNKIYDIVMIKDDDESPTVYYIYMMLYRLYTYYKSIVTDEIDKMILLSFGIKKVLKKHKNNGLRDVLLGNGQVWQLKKRKAKGMLRKNIIATNRNIIKNKSDKKKIKTVHYTVVKRLE